MKLLEIFCANKISSLVNFHHSEFKQLKKEHLKIIPSIEKKIAISLFSTGNSLKNGY